MTEIHNEILFYNLADTPPIDDATPILIDNENANSITIINTSVAGVVFVNNVPLYPFGSGRNAITFRGNENEILAIYHTLKTYENKIGGTQDFDSFQAINQMLEGVKSRMTALILESDPYGNRKKLFRFSTTFSFSNL